jgi:multidrug efflux pump subunit AcrA (membrane-fusion protein)
LLAIVLIPADFDLKARGELQPVIRKDVFAHYAGRVERVLVKHGQRVQEGQVLAELKNTELDVQLEGVLGQLQETAAQKQAAERRLREAASLDEKISASGEALQMEEKEASLRLQWEALDERKEQLKVRSPISGQVISWDVEKSLRGRNISPTEVLIKVADIEGEWELELYMPENRMGHIAAARPDLGDPLKVEYITAAHPTGQGRQGKLREIHSAAQLHEEHGHSVWMVVDINKNDLENPFPGATVTAKVHCGRRSIGYVWLHDLLEWFQSRVLFHL